jgi:3-phosphoshikimate 1-carboxyvinyltransferase
VRFVAAWFGVLQLVGVDVDCGAIPDAAMTLAPIALYAEGPTAIRNVYNW